MAEMMSTTFTYSIFCSTPFSQHTHSFHFQFSHIFFSSTTQKIGSRAAVFGREMNSFLLARLVPSAVFRFKVPFRSSQRLATQLLVQQLSVRPGERQAHAQAF
jgi:hypothetical protein